MSTSGTHFEQVPLARVKKMIAEHPELIQEDEHVVEILTEELKLDDDDKDGTPTLRHGAPPEEDWRELAKRIQSEYDPEKMLGLVQQLVTKFDEERERKNPPPIPGRRICP